MIGKKGSIDLAHFSPWAEQMGESGASPDTKKFKVVAYDYGIKLNILRLLVDHHCDVTVVPANHFRRGRFDVFGRMESFFRTVRAIQKPPHMRSKIFVSWQGVFRSSAFALGPPTLRVGAGWENLQAEIRASRIESSGAESSYQPGGDYPRRITASASTPNRYPSSDVEIHPCKSERSHQRRHAAQETCRSSACSITRRPLPGPHDSHYLFTQVPPT